MGVLLFANLVFGIYILFNSGLPGSALPVGVASVALSAILTGVFTFLFYEGHGWVRWVFLTWLLLVLANLVFPRLASAAIFTSRFFEAFVLAFVLAASFRPESRHWFSAMAKNRAGETAGA